MAVSSVILSVIILLFSSSPSIASADPGTVVTSSTVEELLLFFEEEELWLATGTPKPLKLAPAVATVITAQDIEAMGAKTLDEALETVPGLHVVPSNLNRMNSSYSIRGILTKQNPQVLLLLDGIPIRNFNGGTRPDTFKMSTANISRIEVIRGPGSALYGADAFAGTINIITKNSADIGGTSVNQRFGSFDTYEAGMQHGGSYHGWDIALSLDYLKSDGDKDRIIDADLQTALDAILGTNASLAPGPLDTRDDIFDGQLKLSKDNWNFRVWTMIQNDGGNGAGVAQALDPAGKTKYTIFMTNLTYQNKTLVPDWDLGAHLNYTYNKIDNYIVLLPPGTLVPIGADGNIDFNNPVGLTLFPDGVIGHPGGEENIAGIDLTASYSGFSGHIMRFGAGFNYAELNPFESKNFGPGVLDGTQPVQDGTLTDVTDTPNIYVDETDRENWHILMQDEWSFAKEWTLTAGIRYDHYSDVGGTTNPRLALVWESLEDLTTKLLYGRAFRPPSLVETSYKNNPAAIGNPNVEPETIDTYELVFDYHPAKKFRAAFNFFAYEIEGLIEFLPDAGQSTSTAKNAKDQEGYGFEIEADWLVTDTLLLRGNVAWQHSEDKDTGEIVPDAPGLQFYANAHWKFMPDWSLDAQYFWIGDRHRAEGDPRPKISDYDLVNLTLRRKNIMKHWDFAVAVRNLFDEDAREPSQPSIPNDYPMEGRSFWAELRYTF